MPNFKSVASTISEKLAFNVYGSHHHGHAYITKTLGASPAGGTGCKMTGC